jgi:hypothetical protein
MSESAESPAGSKRLRLRYAGACRGCGAQLPAGTPAIYYSTTKQVECLMCAAVTTPAEATAEVLIDERPEPPPDAGVAGASARREHERRVQRREERTRQVHPRLGGLILALTDEPQSTRAWATGATGEERIGRMLDGLADHGVRLLHDRRIPGTRANIDHIAISPAGVFVIDTKRYQGRPQLRVEGGLLRPRVEKLIVGRRDCTKLVEGVKKQVELVRAAMVPIDPAGSIPVTGILCFVDADWPLIGGSFAISGIRVAWPKKTAELITDNGNANMEQVQAIQRELAAAFPPA